MITILIKKTIRTSNGSFSIFIVELYYYRIQSDLSLTVLWNHTDEKEEVEIISSGGKVGMTSISYGAEKSAVKSFSKILEENGFTIVE